MTERVSIMLFSVVNGDPIRRRSLTDLLLSLYPGSIIYELSESADVVSRLCKHAVDAVIWELTDNDPRELYHLDLLRKQHKDALILLCAEDDSLLDEAMWNGASMYFIKPLLPEQIAAALGAVRKA